MEGQNVLRQALMQAHFDAAINNNNVSSAAVRQVASVGKALPEAIAAACLTLGEIHGPTFQTRYTLFEAENEEIEALLMQGHRIPGYGNAFFKEGIDPAFKIVERMIYQDTVEIGQRIDEVGDLIVRVKGKRFYPNAAAFTASVAHILDVPWHTEIGLVIVARVPAWIRQFNEARHQ